MSFPNQMHAVNNTVIFRSNRRILKGKTLLLRADNDSPLKIICKTLERSKSIHRNKYIKANLFLFLLPAFR